MKTVSEKAITKEARTSVPKISGEIIRKSMKETK